MKSFARITTLQTLTLYLSGLVLIAILFMTTSCSFQSSVAMFSKVDEPSATPPSPPLEDEPTPSPGPAPTPTPPPTPTPVTISYTNPPLHFAKGTGITMLIPALSDTPASVSISPSLPSGLSLDSSTGIISGTPTVAIAPTTYTVTTLSVDGATSTGTVEFEVAIPFVVNTTSDTSDANPGDQVCAIAGGQCSLRAALEEGAALPGVLSLVNLPGNLTYTLGSSLSVNSRLILSGTGSPAPQISGNNMISPVIRINNHKVRMENFMVRDGRFAGNTSFSGVGIQSTSDDLTLKNCTISGNKALVNFNSVNVLGVGLYAASSASHLGMVLVENCSITGNTVTGAAGIGTGGSSGVGAYFSAHSATLLNTTVSSNTSGGGTSFFKSFGAGIFTLANHFTLKSSTLQGNVVDSPGHWDNGGGLYIDGGINALIEDVVCTSNRATYGGGCMYLSSAGAITLNQVSLTDNRDNSSNGGGITIWDSAGAVKIQNSYIEKGAAGTTLLYVHGSENYDVTIQNTTFYNTSGTMITIAGTSEGLVRFENCTLIKQNGTALYKDSNPDVKIYVKNTLFEKIAGGTGGICVLDPFEVVSEGYNLSRDSSCGFLHPTDVADLDPQVSLPALNGGTTRTAAIASTSPARDAIPNGSCSMTRDQRGSTRPNGAACDIGAFEY